MRVSFNPEATACLARIGRHYLALDESAAINVEADIRATIERIRLNPLYYALLGRNDVRRAVTRRYTYLVFFRIVDVDLVDIVSIRHGAERPRFPVEGGRPL